jgi:Glycerate kinase family
VARAAARRHIPVLAVAGRSSLTEAELAGAGLRTVYLLAALQPDPAASMREAAALLRRTGEIIARDLRRTAPYRKSRAAEAAATAENATEVASTAVNAVEANATEENATEADATDAG